MTQPPLLPLTPLQPMTPRRPMTPLQPMAPLTPLTPLTPGTRRQPAPPEPVEFEDLEPLAPPPVVRQAIPKQSTPARPLAGPIGVATSPVPADRVRRSAGGGRVALGFGVAIALIVLVSALSTLKKSSHLEPAVSIPSVSIPHMSIGHVPAAKPSHATQGTPHLGQSLTLGGNATGESIRVTLTRWVDNARPKNTFMDSPAKGKRLVAAQFRITDTGSAGYVDSPSNGAFAFDRTGAKYRPAFMFGGIHQGAVFGPALSLQSGRSAVGFLVFEVPKNAKIGRVQFSEDSGFGQVGEWSLRP